MKNRSKAEFIMAMILLLLVYVCTAKLPYEQAADDTVEKKEKKVILLDAGHGGTDPGKVSVTGRKEKEINLEIVLRVKKCLEKENFEVVLTRENDDGLYKETDSNKKVADMKRRCQIAEESRADIMVSIHQNSYSSEGVHGAQVFYYEHSEQGKKMAESIQKKFRECVDPDNGRQPKANDNYYLLLNVKCPAVIVECGFLSNWEEAEKLETEEYQEKVADAVCQGIVEYLKTS